MEIIEAKKIIDYDRQLTVFGKERADAALQFFMLGANGYKQNIEVPTDAEITHYWKRKNCFGQYLEGLEHGSIWMRDKLLSAKTEA